MNSYIEKVTTNKDKYIIFYSEWCKWSQKALDLLRTKNLPYKGYKIKEDDGWFQQLLDSFKGMSSVKFDAEHETRPVIFKFGKFLGGYTELAKDISTSVER